MATDYKSWERIINHENELNSRNGLAIAATDYKSLERIINRGNEL